MITIVITDSMEQMLWNFGSIASILAFLEVTGVIAITEKTRRALNKLRHNGGETKK
jgi:hypothetical protein